MNVLHVGWGFKPWWGGGYSEYLEDLVTVQARHRREVSYLCCGRRYDGFNGPRLVKWKAFGVKVYEILNCSSATPGDGSIETIVKDCIGEISPDIVHVHELIGFPASLIDLVKDDLRLPLVMTIHDYFMFCPNTTLFDRTGRNCDERVVGEKCASCVREYPPSLAEHKIRNLLEIKHYPLYRFLVSIYRFLFRPEPVSSAGAGDCREAPYFQARRDLNIAGIRKADKIIAPSQKVGAIVKHFAGDDISDRMVVLPYVLEHLKYIRPAIVQCGKPIRFVTLQGCANPGKGSRVIADAVEALTGKGYAGKFELYVYGYIDPEVRQRLVRMNNVFYKGLYETWQLNRILAGKDVGIVPSVRQEPYGIVGLELLAKGIPVIGSSRGGIVDYVKDGTTGWVEMSSTGEGLAALMQKIIDDPGQVERLSMTIAGKRSVLIRTMDEHLADIENIYHDAIRLGRMT